MIYLVGAVILWVVPIFVANSIGKSKHRDAGAAYGIFLGWIGVLVLAVLPPLSEKTLAQELAQLERDRGLFNSKAYDEKLRERMDAEDAESRRYRECPFCKERMRADATVCPHCRHESATPELAGV